MDDVTKLPLGKVSKEKARSGTDSEIGSWFIMKEHVTVRKINSNVCYLSNVWYQFFYRIVNLKKSFLAHCTLKMMYQNTILW